MHHRRTQESIQTIYGGKLSDHSEFETAIKRQENFVNELEKQKKLAKNLVQKNSYEEVNEKREKGFSAFVNGANRYINGVPVLTIPKPKNPSNLTSIYKNKYLFFVPRPKAKAPPCATNLPSPKYTKIRSKSKNTNSRDTPNKNTHPYYSPNIFTYHDEIAGVVPAQFSSEGVIDLMPSADLKTNEPLLSSQRRYYSISLAEGSSDADGDSIDLSSDAIDFRHRKSAKLSVLKSKRFNRFLKQWRLCCAS